MSGSPPPPPTNPIEMTQACPRRLFQCEGADGNQGRHRADLDRGSCTPSHSCIVTGSRSSSTANRRAVTSGRPAGAGRREATPDQHPKPEPCGGPGKTPSMLEGRQGVGFIEGLAGLIDTIPRPEPGRRRGKSARRR